MVAPARQLALYVDPTRQLPLELRPLRAPACICDGCDQPVVCEMENAVPAPVCAFDRDRLIACGWRVKGAAL